MLLPLYHRFLFEQARDCDPQNGIVHHVVGSKLFQSQRHEGFVTCARRLEKEILVNGQEEHISIHKRFFNPRRIHHEISPRIRGLVQEMVQTGVQAASN